MLGLLPPLPEGEIDLRGLKRSGGTRAVKQAKGEAHRYGPWKPSNAICVRWISPGSRRGCPVVLARALSVADCMVWSLVYSVMAWG